MTPMKKSALSLAIGLLLSPALQAESSSDAATAAELRELQQVREDLLRRLQEFDQRIKKLEQKQRGKDTLQSETVSTQNQQLASTTAPDSEPVKAESLGYRPGNGFNLVTTEHGDVNVSLFTYVRYLNQKNFDDTYTDSFGNNYDIDIRNDVQLQKVNLTFKGWLFDPDFTYKIYTWTANTSQGDPAQVVVAGYMNYHFSDYFNFAGGVNALPTTRSTNNTFPNWLKNDHRSIADEYFRGSYTMGFWATGKISPTVKYNTMLGNNLSQLGVDAAQLDDGFNTFSTALWWMPTTGEYGKAEGFGDYEFHEELATLFGIHYTRSREDQQAQPGTNTFENTQLRLSDGTRLFSEDPFGTGGEINKITYQMIAANAGFKYRGWAVEGEVYYRHLDNFQTTGMVPIDSVTDHGFQLQGSTMLVPKRLQAYAEFSKIYGDNGNPHDFSLGLNWYPFDRKETHVSVQGLYLDDSPVGYASVPFSVGGNGWAFTTDFIISF